MSFKAVKTPCPDACLLSKEYSAAKRCDAFRFGSEHVFVKKGLRVSYLAYTDVKRYFRRILAVPLKISCCGGVMELQNIVFSDDQSELMTVQLKDPRMLDCVLEALSERLPHAAFGKPQSAAAAAADSAGV